MNNLYRDMNNLYRDMIFWSYRPALYTLPFPLLFVITQLSVRPSAG